MNIQTLLTPFARKRSSALPPKDRSDVRVGIPKVLNIWNTHQFWLGFLTGIGIKQKNIVFSSNTSEDQFREFGKGRGTVDCCYPVKCMSGHYGELMFGQKHKINVLLSPLIYSLPSFMNGHVVASNTCTRVMAGAENIKSGFLKERDVFAENNIKYVSPYVNLDDRAIVPEQMYNGLKECFDLNFEETKAAVELGFKALDAFNAKVRNQGLEILRQCAVNRKPCVLVLARPYHMDTGIGHEIETDLQAYGFPILWMQYFPIDDALLNWIFEDDLKEGRIKNPFDISDVWPSSYSSNTNEILWAAKVAARCPWITCVIRLSSYECGMDQPTFTPTQKIIEASGTLFFRFGDLDATKPSGSIRIRVETIVHYVRKYSDSVISKKLARMGSPCPILPQVPNPKSQATSPKYHAPSIKEQPLEIEV